MTTKKLSKQKAEVVKSLPSKIPYIYPYKLPSGEVRYRVRIRKKSFAGKALDSPINEVYHTIEQAKKRLYDLEFGNVLQERAEMSRCLDSWDHVPMRSWPLFKARQVLCTLFQSDLSLVA